MVTSALSISLSESIPIPTLGCERRAISHKSRANILARAQTGDADAFSELYSQHRKRVFSYLSRMVHDFWLAEVSFTK
jgi:hypothetical protein